MGEKALLFCIFWLHAVLPGATAWFPIVCVKLCQCHGVDLCLSSVITKTGAAFPGVKD